MPLACDVRRLQMTACVTCHAAQKARENRSYAKGIDVTDRLSAGKFICEFYRAIGDNRAVMTANQLSNEKGQLGRAGLAIVDGCE